MSQEILSKAVLDKLCSDKTTGSVHALLAGRIYHLRAPDETLLPWLNFTLSQDQPQAWFDESDDVECQVTLDLWSKGSNGILIAQIINDKLHALLHRQPLTIVGYAQSQMVCMDRGVAQIHGQAIRIRSIWRLWASRV
jgi:hypothetical protein